MAPASEFTCTVTSTKTLTPSVFEICFSTNTPMDFKAGQYVSIVVPHEGKPLRRPYSIASQPGKNPVELCIQRIENGPGNTFLAGLRSGDTFSAFAPYGFLVHHPKPGRDVFFIATGTGIAPFRSMILSKEFIQSPPRKTVCLLGVRTQDEILYGHEMSRQPGIKWVPCLSRVEKCGPDMCLGRVTKYLRDHDEEIAWPETDFYLCGNGAMIDEVKSLLREKGVGKEAIYQEIYFKPPKA